jgi:hypothetical protein
MTPHDPPRTWPPSTIVDLCPPAMTAHRSSDCEARHHALRRLGHPARGARARLGRLRRGALVTLAVAILVPPSLALYLGGSATGARPDGVRNGRADPRYATQSGSRTATRRAHRRWVNAEHEDSGYETCAIFPLGTWARRLHVRAEPASVARAFAARNYEPGLRAGAYAGCLAALREGAVG